MSGSSPEGYEGALSYIPEYDITSLQLSVSQVGENANWGMCVNSTMSAPFKTKVKAPSPSRDVPLAGICFRNIFVITSEVVKTKKKPKERVKPGSHFTVPKPALCPWKQACV